MELKTHECLQFFLPRIAVALEEIAKAAKFDMEEKKIAKELEEKKIAKELSKLKNKSFNTR